MRNLFWGIILIIIGIFILLDNLGYADFSELLRDYWPLLLIIWGLSVIVRHRPRKDQQQHVDRTTIIPPIHQPTQPVDSDLVHQSNVLGDVHSRITSQNFKGGSLSTVFGDAYFDLSAAAFAEGDHELRVHSVFGDSTVVLPKDAAVSIAANSLFGDLSILGQYKSGISSDITISTPAYASSTRRMKITISKVFGNVRVVE